MPHPPQDTAIRVDGVVVRYPRFTLGPATFAVARGERCAVVGANGAGKSTLLSALAGQLTPDAGTAHIGVLAIPGDLVAVRATVAYVGERLLCCPWLTAAQHFTLQAHFFPQWEARAALETARALSLPLDVPLGNLSRGNSMKAALCSAVAQHATVLLLDEPTAGLDPVARAELLRLLSTELAARPELTILFATHILEDLDDLGATALVTLRNGSLAMHAIPSASGRGAARELAQQLLFASLPERAS
ncbi:MAG TPA: ABC transporter ATP-binding protein [Gemmatimonadaceae bacterium]|nr:ABC transporter ATP-binding protein [Gemmatimonadaceae bacterium]